MAMQPPNPPSPPDEFGTPVPQPPATGWISQLGPRADRRSEPRLSVVLAAAGCALAVVGVLIISGDLLVGDVAPTGDSSTNQIPGIVLSGLVMVAGYILLAKFPDDALGTAGVVASALSTPALVFFLTFSDSSFPPFSTEAIFGLSAIIWLGSYAVGPGRGHPFYLGAGLIGLWLFVLEIVEGVFTFPFDAVAGFGVGLDPGFDGGFGGDPFDPAPDVPSVETLGVLTLLFAVGYLVASRHFDKAGKSGIATPFAVAALVSFPVAILFLSDSLGNLLTGVAFIALGVGYGFGGATTGRRLTTWLGGYYVAQGGVVVVTEIVGDEPSATTVGAAMIVVGVLIVGAGQAVRSQFGEPKETTPGPSTFTKQPTWAAPVAPMPAAQYPPAAAPPQAPAGYAQNPPPPAAPPPEQGAPPPGAF